MKPEGRVVAVRGANEPVLDYCEADAADRRWGDRATVEILALDQEECSLDPA